MKYVFVIVCLAVLGGAGYWYAERHGWLTAGVPSNPPTAEERARMEEVERRSAERAPNAVPGAGVRPKGTLPPTPVPEVAKATSSTTTTPAQ